MANIAATIWLETKKESKEVLLDNPHDGETGNADLHAQYFCIIGLCRK